MQNVSVQRKRNPGDTDKNGIISEYREILREAGASLFLRTMCVSGFMNIADWQQICLVHRKRCTRYETRWEIIEEAGRIPESICKSEGE